MVFKMRKSQHTRVPAGMIQSREKMMRQEKEWKIAGAMSLSKREEMVSSAGVKGWVSDSNVKSSKGRKANYLGEGANR